MSKALVTARCENCFWWNQFTEDAAGGCAQSKLSRRDLRWSTLVPGGLAVTVRDGFRAGPSLVTHKDFGCVNWEKRTA